MLAPTDQGHFLKYLTTLGVAIIVATLGLGGFLLQAQSDLMVEQAKLSTLTPVAKEALQRKQATILAATKIAPWAAAGLVAIGLTMTISGLVGWRRKQTILDRKDFLEVDKLEVELTHLSESQAAEKVADEVKEILGEGVAELKEYDNPAQVMAGVGDRRPSAGDSGDVTKILETILKTLDEKLRAAWPSTESGPFAVRKQMALKVEDGRSIALDNVVIDSIKKRTYLIELKYFLVGPSADRMLVMAANLAAAAQILTRGRKDSDFSFHPVGIIIVEKNRKNVETRTRRLLSVYGNGFAIEPAFLVYQMDVFVDLSPEQLRLDINAVRLRSKMADY